MSTVRYIGRAPTYTYYYNSTKVLFSGIDDFQDVPLQHIRELVQNGNFLPSKEAYNMLHDVYHPMNKSPEGFLKGKDCVIVGSGASLKEFNFNALSDKFIIALNHSIYFFDSHACLFIDRKFLKDDNQKAIQFLKGYKGMIFTAWRSKYHLMPKKSNKVHYFSLNIRNEKKEYYNGLYCGKSSGLCAINLALIMEAKNIYLLGFDYDDKMQPKHFYNNVGEDKFKNESSYTNAKCNSISQMFSVYADHKNIINCNLNSQIKCFEFGEIQ